MQAFFLSKFRSYSGGSDISLSRAKDRKSLILSIIKVFPTRNLVLPLSNKIPLKLALRRFKRYSCIIHTFSSAIQKHSTYPFKFAIGLLSSSHQSDKHSAISWKALRFTLEPIHEMYTFNKYPSQIDSKPLHAFFSFEMIYIYMDTVSY